ncbi:MAG: hypothetical protein I3I97_01200 [Bifidobacterium thermophilum]|nr:hypothetical protein [Bifidobacterium thermophilum]
MSLNEAFETFFTNIQIDNMDEVKKSLDAIASKLDSVYHDGENGSSSSGESHLLAVGSVGRKTAVKGADGKSDVDVIYNLPDSVYDKFDGYRSNGQSALIQDLKDTLLERYPRTKIRGDGQVVDIFFDKYTIELVPVFKDGGGFLYPDTHDGGSWKQTNPLAEQKACEQADQSSNGVYRRLCQGIRCWRNANNFEMRGILIDALVYDFCTSDYGRICEESGHLQLFMRLFDFLKNQKSKYSSWFAPGSGQEIENHGDEAFIPKAEKACREFEECSSPYEALSEIFGSDFPCEGRDSDVRASSVITESYLSHDGRSANTEEFIENLIEINPRYDLRLDCLVTQNGFRPFWLRGFLGQNAKKKKYLQRRKTLRFSFLTDCPKPYQIWWKVRNVGPEAERRNMIRGQIRRTNEECHYEHTDFYGPHFVECYLVCDGVCVARDRISVPIGED